MAKRPLSSILNSAAVGQRRRAVYRFDTSVDLFEIPAWFDPKRDTLYISGCAGGGGGAGSNGTVNGSAGAAGASATRVPFRLSPDTKVLKIIVGSGGAAGAATKNGVNGGSSEVRNAVVPNYVLYLAGGVGGYGHTNEAGATLGGDPRAMGTNLSNGRAYNTDTVLGNASSIQLASYLEAFGRTAPLGLVTGRDGYMLTTVAPAVPLVNTTNTNLAATPSVFGGIGNIGYGYGGAAAPSVTAQAGAPGAPGVIILEFVEG